MVFLPLALGWAYPNIFSPIHIILLELIMGPTCSIIYENEPIEADSMKRNPRPFSNTFFNWRELLTSIAQGLMITLGALLVYQYALLRGFNEDLTRTMVFTVLLTANIFLTLVNRSFYYSIITTLRYKNRLVPVIIAISSILSLMLVYAQPLAQFFAFQKLKPMELAICVSAGFVFVIWYELVKWRARITYKPDNTIIEGITV
jgi:Ca2+-transporting ATPase